VKVFHFIDSLRAGGKERQLLQLVQGLHEYDVQTLIGVMDDEEFFGRMDGEGVECRRIRRRFRWDPSVFLQLTDVLKQYRPQIIHTHDWMTSFYALPLARAMGIPLINGSIRNCFVRTDLRWRIERQLILRSDVAVANSDAGLRSRGLTPSPHHVVIRNGFDSSRLQNLKRAEQIRQSLDIDTAYVVGMVAMFKTHKDYATYLSAADAILNERSDVTFLAIGDGEMLDECRQSVAHRTKGIRFPGARQDVESIVNIFDIGVLATPGEGISTSIMEYMALGKPVIASEGGATHEIVVDGETGFLVPQRDVRAMADRIRQLLDDRSLAARMGAAGRQRMTDCFSLERLTTDTVAVYRSVAGEHEPNPSPPAHLVINKV
jgi:glycosyltransferase involved in cell wall biosynthesis